jgi:hypothetical protein
MSSKFSIEIIEEPMTNNKAREINSPVIKQLIDETKPEAFKNGWH